MQESLLGLQASAGVSQRAYGTCFHYMSSLNACDRVGMQPNLVVYKAFSWGVVIYSRLQGIRG